jgi:hypothetical protein
LPSRRKKRNWALIIILFSIIAFVGGTAYLIQVVKPCSSFPFPSIAGRSLQMHVHTQLLIVIDDQQLELPANIGDGDFGGCQQPIHNHSNGPNTNVLHVESPTIQDFTLGNAFKVWAATTNIQGPKPVVFNQDQIFNHTIGGNKEIRMFVNGERSFKFENLVLGDKMTIVIVYGDNDTSWSTYQNMSREPWPYGNL